MPLTRLLHPKEPFQWTAEAEQAFNALKNCFVTGYLLWYPNSRLPFTVEANASSVVLGAVLSQKYNLAQPLQPCKYYSWRLTAMERNYTIWERDLLAIKVAFEIW